MPLEGIEPPAPEPESGVLSVKLWVHLLFFIAYVVYHTFSRKAKGFFNFLIFYKPRGGDVAFRSIFSSAFHQAEFSALQWDFSVYAYSKTYFLLKSYYFAGFSALLRGFPIYAHDSLEFGALQMCFSVYAHNKAYFSQNSRHFQKFWALPRRFSVYAYDFPELLEYESPSKCRG